MLGAHVFKQSTCKPAHCNVSVSVVHDDYRSDVEAALEKMLMQLLLYWSIGHIRFTALL
jgi:hypothetical protein